jgi:mRNA-degrading endonuclease RelE of RelBE toxin-antitoxin system
MKTDSSIPSPRLRVLASPSFKSEAKRLGKKYYSLDDDLEQLVKSLLENPLQGVSLGNNLYKILLAIKSKGKGKSGGARVITMLRV